MPTFATLSVFTAAVLLLLMSPGPNMAFVLAHGVRHGWRGGAAAAGGIGTADVVLTALTATGITAVVTRWPLALDAIRWAGALYLLWMAWKALQSRPGLAPQSGASHQATLASVWWRATLNSLLNPKALLFSLVFLPQFVDPARGPVGLQLAVLGAVLTLISTVFHAALGVLGGAATRRLAQHAGASPWPSRLLALVLALLAVRLVVVTSA